MTKRIAQIVGNHCMCLLRSDDLGKLRMKQSEQKRRGMRQPDPMVMFHLIAPQQLQVIRAWAH